MAQVINTEKKPKITPNPSGRKSVDNTKRPPLFRPVNYILMAVGIVILIIGYFCLVGGAPESPDQFNPEVFNTRRIVVSPILILIGLVTEIIAIMWHPKQKKTEVAEEQKAE